MSHATSLCPPGFSRTIAATATTYTFVLLSLHSTHDYGIDRTAHYTDTAAKALLYFDSRLRIADRILYHFRSFKGTPFHTVLAPSTKIWLDSRPEAGLVHHLAPVTVHSTGVKKSTAITTAVAHQSWIGRHCRLSVNQPRLLRTIIDRQGLLHRESSSCLSLDCVVSPLVELQTHLER